jgi:phytanoyl-CoA hydroxylase
VNAAPALSAEQIAAFARDGYLVIDGFLDEAEIVPIEAVFERFLQGDPALVDGMGRDFCDMSGPYERAFADFNIVNAVLPRKYAPYLIGNIFEQRAQALAEQLIGPEARLDYDQFLSKRPGREQAVFAWHQDLGYWPTGTPDTRTTTFSLALDDATPENGCLQVVPGSHREPTLRWHRPAFRTDPATGLREQAHTLTIDLAAEDEVVFLPVKRGGITIHNERIVHGSAGNPSPNWRRTYILAHRPRATVEFERSIGFTHSHNDSVAWETHLDALRAGEA